MWERDSQTLVAGHVKRSVGRGCGDEVLAANGGSGPKPVPVERLPCEHVARGVVDDKLVWRERRRELLLGPAMVDELDELDAPVAAARCEHDLVDHV
jgi:hypothetical protein